MRAALVLPALLLVVSAAPVGAPATPRQITLEAVAVACPGVGDGICLAYNGTTPGPTLVVGLGETVQVTLVNRIAQTIWSVPGPVGVRERLAAMPVSFHVHGTALGVESDGLVPMGGAHFPDARAKVNGSYTYTFRAAHNGTWHYHDHVIGADGMEGVARGLMGTLLVRSGAEARPDVTVDVHCVDGRCWSSPASAAPAGGRIEVVFVVLGDDVWSIAFGGRALEMGPGMSEHVVIANAHGAYAWSAFDPARGEETTGEVIAG